MNFKQFETREKLLGMYETPQTIGRLLAQYTVPNSGRCRILELGTGKGALLRAIEQQARDSNADVHYYGIEVDENSCGIATNESETQKVHRMIEHSDAFEKIATLDGQFDAAVGNPPYIRYQYLEKKQQDMADELFARLSVPFTRHTNSWTTFLLASFNALRPGGKLAMIIPAEVLHVLHARGTRNYLSEHCSTIPVVEMEDMLFDALQGAIIIFAQRKAVPTAAPGTLSIVRYRDLGELPLDVREILTAAVPVESTPDLEYKWMSGFLSKPEIEALEELRLRGTIVPFDQIASIDVGIVTGANAFFLVTEQVASEFQLWPWLLPAFGRSEHVRGAILTTSDHKRNVKEQLPSYMLIVEPTAQYKDFPSNLRRYLEVGVRQKLPSRYKCRIRNPWWSVPSVYSSPVTMLKRSNDIPRLVLNRAGAINTDTAYRIFPKKGISAGSLVGAFVNSVTALSAEINGRHYGGGVLELVPSEAERLVVPLVVSAKPAALDRDIRAKMGAAEILQLQDGRLYEKATLGRVAVLHEAWTRLRRRRRRAEQRLPAAANA